MRSIVSKYVLPTFVTIVCAHGLFFTSVHAQSRFDGISITAGIGVNYHDVKDIVDRINGGNFGGNRLGAFKTGAEFFGAIGFPVAAEWIIKAEYVYMLASYNINTVYGVANFSYNVHMPSIIFQYVMFRAETYDVKMGLGAGYHFGVYSEKYSNYDQTFTGKGVGTLLDLEANTALGENLFAHLGSQVRWDFIGDLTNGAGQSPLGATPITMHFFSIGARLGMAYYF